MDLRNLGGGLGDLFRQSNLGGHRDNDPEDESSLEKVADLTTDEMEEYVCLSVLIDEHNSLQKKAKNLQEEILPRQQLFWLKLKRKYPRISEKNFSKIVDNKEVWIGDNEKSE